MVSLGLVGSVLVHLFLGLWASGLLIPGPDLSRDDAVSVQLVPPEKAPPPPRLPAAAVASGPAKAMSAIEPAPAPPPGGQQEGSSAKYDPGKAIVVDPTELTRDEVAGMIEQTKFCWNLPAGWNDSRQVSVTVRFLLNRDGTLRGRPVVVEFPASTLGMEAAENAVLAIIACSPFALPPEKYDQWRDVQLRLEP